MPSGGPRQPARPAAVSGPGALSQRTDGGAGSAKQPIRVPTGGAYGEAKASREQQQAAPMAAGGPGGPSPGGAAAPAMDVGVFGPTTMPGQSIMTGTEVPGGEGQLQDPQMVLRALAQRWPSPWILGMLDD